MTWQNNNKRVKNISRVSLELKNEDILECKNVLETHGCDLEVAVQDTLNVREGRLSVYQENRPANRHRRISNNQTFCNSWVFFLYFCKMSTK